MVSTVIFLGAWMSFSSSGGPGATWKSIRVSSSKPILHIIQQHRTGIILTLIIGDWKQSGPLCFLHRPSTRRPAHMIPYIYTSASRHSQPSEIIRLKSGEKISSMHVRPQYTFRHYGSHECTSPLFLTFRPAKACPDMHQRLQNGLVQFVLVPFDPSILLLVSHLLIFAPHSWVWTVGMLILLHSGDNAILDLILASGDGSSGSSYSLILATSFYMLVWTCGFTLLRLI